MNAARKPPTSRAALAIATWLVAHVAHAGGPPPGWEVPPPREEPVLRPSDRCGDDAECVRRQTALDAPPDSTPWQAFEVDFASLPAVRSLASPADEAALRDVPAVRAFDGLGRPFPWPDGAKREVRIMPPGALGEITWRSGWPVPFFADAKYRSMGYGTMHVLEGPEDVKQALSGAVSYVSIDRDGKDVVLDRVVGKLDGSPRIIATRWEHVVTAHLAGGLGHAYREDGDRPKVVLLFPEVSLDAETTHVSLGGGFVPGDRFSTHAAFTRYVMPAGTEASATISFHVRDRQRRRWLQPEDAPPELATYVVSVSRSSVEKAPRLVVLTRPRKSDR